MKKINSIGIIGFGKFGKLLVEKDKGTIKKSIKNIAITLNPFIN